MLALKSCLSHHEVEFILKKTADVSVNNTTLHPENAPFVNVSGAGRVDAHAAVMLVENWPQNLVNYAGISGPPLLCTSATFTLNNVPAGMMITWSASSNVSITSGQNTTAVTLIKVSNGASWVKATVTSPCNLSVEIPQNNFWSGPYGSGQYPITGPTSVCKNQYVYVNTTELTGTTNINWQWPSSWTYVSGQGTRWLALRTTSLSSTGVVSVRVDNTCGTGGSYATKLIAVSNCGSFALYPNPSSEELNIEGMSLGEKEGSIVMNRIEILDATGTVRRSQAIMKHSCKIDIRDLEAGTYIVKISTDKEVITERILVKH